MGYLPTTAGILFWILASSIQAGIYGGYEARNADTGDGSYSGGNSYGNGYADYNAPRTYIYEEYSMSSESSESSSSSESEEIMLTTTPKITIESTKQTSPKITSTPEVTTIQQVTTTPQATSTPEEQTTTKQTTTAYNETNERISMSRERKFDSEWENQVPHERKNNHSDFHIILVYKHVHIDIYKHIHIDVYKHDYHDHFM
ncbi:hypothetical protein WR25_02494 [Diploscapter pachys]|uniref:Uncharacterized protein n=1 Tax=Diploscapter pachys TaxID=2018661 RepID=A0A2A2LID5_9BILA|nr:hypothetical protein WR25_02494 [Diploscapter pachys]